MVSTVIPVQPFDLVIFGATGDLAHRKILPSLYRRLSVHQMPQEARIIGAARSKMSRAEFRKSVQGALEEFVEPGDLSKERVEAFLATLDYVTIDAPDAELAHLVDEVQGLGRRQLLALQMRAIASIIRLLQCLRTWRVQPSGFRPLRKPE